MHWIDFAGGMCVAAIAQWALTYWALKRDNRPCPGGLETGGARPALHQGDAYARF